MTASSCSWCEGVLPEGSRRKVYCSDACSFEAGKAKARELKLRRHYGISIAEYDDLWLSQEGKCAICKRVLTPKNSCVDHDHVSGVTRGILCQVCNRRLLPASRDNADILLEAAAYLMRPPAVELLGVRIGTDPILKGKPRRKRRKRRAPVLRGGSTR